MARPIRCPKCGLMQMARGQCKNCGTPFEGTAAPDSMPARPVVSAAPIEPTSHGNSAAAVAVAAPPMPQAADMSAPAPALSPPPPAPSAAPPPVAEIPGVAAYSEGTETVESELDSAPFQVESAEHYNEEIDPIFDRDRFLLRQKVLTIHEKYEVWSEDGDPIVYVERPGRYLRNLGAMFAGLIAAGMIGTAAFYGTRALGDSAAAPAVAVIGILLAIIALFTVSTALSAKRHLYFYRDNSKNDLLFEVLQDQKFVLFTHTYTVIFSGASVAQFSKNILTDIFRKQWRCFDAGGQLICVAKEDSILKALIRRFATRLLPLNFIFYNGQTDQVIGQFDRKFTLLDRYVLDMSLDVGGVLDRRIALALGVLLDTGERR